VYAAYLEAMHDAYEAEMNACSERERDRRIG